MFQAVLLWIVAWWLVEIVEGEPVGLGVGLRRGNCAMGLAFQSVNAVRAAAIALHVAPSVRLPGRCARASG